MGRHRSRTPGAPVRALVDGLDQEGRGVARGDDGKVVFIEGALPGEEVLYSQRRSRKRFDEGVVVEVLHATPGRVTPACPYFVRCGGCSQQHMAHSLQLESKQANLLEALRTIAKLRPQRVSAPLSGPVWAYRRRARLGVKYVPGKGGVLIGFRERHAPGKIAEIDACAVLDPLIGARIAALRSLIDGLTARARIPQIEVAVGDQRVALVVRHLDPLGEGDRAALAAFEREQHIDIHLQAGGLQTLTPLSQGTPATLTYSLPAYDLEFQFQVTDFVQINATVNRSLVDHALRLLDPQPDDRILDSYCGIGNFTLPIAQRCRQITGLEGSPDLIERARANAARNGCDNVRFEALDLDLPGAAKSYLSCGWEKLLLDPPRTGAAALVATLRKPYPVRIVYVSCNPGTLARDAGALVSEHGYTLVEAGIVDMFPHTRHVESVALFER